MAEPTPVALAAAPIPSSAQIKRAEKLVRERFVHAGEDPAVALAPGSPRRRALDQALAELDADPKAKRPSTAWRREFSLLLGLERLLSEDEPALGGHRPKPGTWTILGRSFNPPPVCYMLGAVRLGR